jgi:ABC-2 type transport system permease protein
MNIFIRELKANRKALIIWSICMFLLVLGGMSKYTAYSSGGASSDVFNKMSSTMKALLGIGSFDVTTMSGFFAMLFIYVELTAAIHAVLLGSGIIAKEERDKTTEFLIVKPVSRTAVITQKIMAATVNILVLNIVTFFSSVIMVASFNKGKDITGEIATFLLSMFIIQLVFLSLGAFLSALIRNPKASGSLAAGILMGAFIISKITDLNEGINTLNILSPFKYFNLTDMVNGNGLSVLVVFLTALLIAAFTFSTYIFYRKRDLSI